MLPLSNFWLLLAAAVAARLVGAVVLVGIVHLSSVSPRAAAGRWSQPSLLASALPIRSRLAQVPRALPIHHWRKHQTVLTVFFRQSLLLVAAVVGTIQVLVVAMAVLAVVARLLAVVAVVQQIRVMVVPLALASWLGRTVRAAVRLVQV